jgi:lysine-specific histone demethylase 1
MPAQKRPSGGGSPSSPKRKKGKNSTKTVVIVGAGMAGLSAARELQEFGHKVIVLEARERTGGRCSSEYFGTGDAAVDVGAAWIHGTEGGNPLVKLCSEFQLSLYDTGEGLTLYDHDGTLVSKECDDGADALFNGILDRTKESKFTTESYKTASLGEVLQELLSAQELSPQELRLWDWNCSNLEYATATNLDNLSLQHWDMDDSNEFTGPHCLIKEGYGALAERLGNELHDLRLGVRVAAVNYGPEVAGVEVHTRGPEGHGVVAADMVIITLPLGVLKAGSVKFEPALPAPKRTAIGKLGYGLLNKVLIPRATRHLQTPATGCLPPRASC